MNPLRKNSPINQLADAWSGAALAVRSFAGATAIQRCTESLRLFVVGLAGSCRPAELDRFGIFIDYFESAAGGVKGGEGASDSWS